jgi:hypothetical protein
MEDVATYSSALRHRRRRSKLGRESSSKQLPRPIRTQKMITSALKPR